MSMQYIIYTYIKIYIYICLSIYLNVPTLVLISYYRHEDTLLITKESILIKLCLGHNTIVCAYHCTVYSVQCSQQYKLCFTQCCTLYVCCAVHIYYMLYCTVLFNYTMSRYIQKNISQNLFNSLFKNLKFRKIYCTEYSV